MSRLLAIVALLVLAASPALASNTATVLRISADPNGGMRFVPAVLRAKPGQVTVAMKNPSVVPHNVAVRGNGVQKRGKVVLKGGTSSVTAALKTGRYVLFCSVPGHEQAGMKGTLTVR